MDKPLILVNFSIGQDIEPEFNRFYHGDFLPAIFRESAAVECIRRYEEFGVGATLRWYHKQFLTIYQLKDEASLENADQVFTNAAVEPMIVKFREWKDKALRNFSRTTYRHSWSHPRKSSQREFGGPLFLWQLEMKLELDEDFQRWYEQDYLPLQIAEIPTWTGCRRYRSEGKEQLRHLTVFETSDESTLNRCQTDLRAPHRVEQNYKWQQMVEPAVLWHDASSFRPIYRWPD